MPSWKMKSNVETLLPQDKQDEGIYLVGIFNMVREDGRPFTYRKSAALSYGTPEQRKLPIFPE